MNKRKLPKRKPPKRRYKGAKVLHARRYAPKRIESRKKQLARWWLRNELAGWGHWS